MSGVLTVGKFDEMSHDHDGDQSQQSEQVISNISYPILHTGCPF